jgi:hypothetical protein
LCPCAPHCDMTSHAQTLHAKKHLNNNWKGSDVAHLEHVYAHSCVLYTKILNAFCKDNKESLTVLV